MDKHTIRVLEFERVLEMAGAFAVTAPGRDIVRNIRPDTDIDKIQGRINQVSECRRIFSEGRVPGIENFDDLSMLFNRIRPSDSVIEPSELRLFLPLMFSSINLKVFCDDPLCDSLRPILLQLTSHPDIRKSIDESIDNEGKIRDDASRELNSIRKNIKKHESRIRGLLDSILGRKDLLPHLQDFYVTQRNNRWVIPVKSDSKGSVPGVVHDISNTGETVFIEPYSVQQAGNELESLKAEEKLEEYRILKRLTSILREHLHEIEEDYRIVAGVDALQAIAIFSDKMGMSPPEINLKGYMRIVDGVHPLLWRAFGKDNREQEIMPLNLELGRGHSGMVITGSNAGGKTVALKTVGILNIMALAGMHIPAGSGSTIPYLNRIYADIGDEQSIDQNLSTFSAHIKRISGIIQESDKHSMIIIDELGTGTDPAQGGALSCAILKRIKQKGALSVVSTHLGMLKAFAHSEPGMINSAMEMEEVEVKGAKTYRPTYKLIVGEPGTSHAFEIAESLGLHEDVIKEARKFVSGEDARIESLISDLKEKTGAVEKRLRDADELKREVATIRSSLEEKLSGIKLSKQEIISRALVEAEEIIRSAKTETRDIIKALKKSRQSESITAIKDLDKKQAVIKKAIKQYSPETLNKLENVVAGQRVFINTLGINSAIHSINKKAGTCKVAVKGKEITVHLRDISEPLKEKDNRTSSEDKKRRTASYLTVDRDVPGELNIIGQRVDPALSILERYINEVSMSDIDRVRIIHGIGSGILSAAVREYLNDHPLVERSTRGDEEEGGDAVTVVFL